ncbi:MULTISPECIES: FAD-dependent oxidoreductase [Pseudomonas]|uniref:Amino acid dehydrogenase n=1 Tax=Pseudomonas quebecensis TaxID=2995174 RepID=A0ABY6QJX4_9PSED|nr:MULTISPECIES: FAD-dependent oxidoreductase [Pseudomonas]MCP1512174.1 lactate dehydrogenase-like 2-hydroxyacid dehydrogenase [Pseudomonas rhodesiae]MCX4064136.1 amino acid dehydrogenase [Pseudomonas quebecensis]UZW19996.1 amino acid dehydrogenase [Pseudomonas quebecensis]UZW22586.1 amino acid dehydrogenase [Pseudomonas quebecensis]UZW27648.1 amino acid dehydrogenase [Pseudomonas quebecensis]
MTLSCVPPVVASLIATLDTVLHIAPVSRRWRAEAPGNVVFLPPTIPQQTLLLQIALLRPSTLIVADQVIDADLIERWRVAHPFGDLCLIRRGTSLDKVRLDLCEANHIRVINTPGVNAPHVAAYVAHWLTLSNDTMPLDICVLGYGNVGKELVKLLLKQDSDARIRVLERKSRILNNRGSAQLDNRVSFFDDWHEAMKGAHAVAICLSLNEESAHRIDQTLIQCLHSDARLICVAKPDVFSSEALRALAVTDDVQLILDYGPATLEAFRIRAKELDCAIATWRRPPMLTTHAATTENCNCDLDYAVSVQLSLTALRGLVRRKLTQPLTIPSQPANAGAPQVSIIGRGINGLLQAVMLRLANYRVVVYGGNSQNDGASHKLVNMRHMSATETMAKPLHNDYLFPINQYLTVECNRAGIELFEKLLVDNPSLAPFTRSKIVRAYTDNISDVDAAIGEQRDIENRPWPSGKPGSELKALTQQTFSAEFGVPGVDQAVEVSGYDLEFIQLMAEIEVLLRRAGVQFRSRHLSAVEIAQLSREHIVVTAMGIEEQAVLPIIGWFFKLRAMANEGASIRGLKLQYELPIGVMNCRLDEDCILISGGQVPPGSSPEYKEQILAACLAAVSRHFPTSYRMAVETGDLHVIECARPGTQDGLSIVYYCAHNRIAAGGTYAAGTTQGLLWAALVQEIIQAKAPMVLAMNAH